MAIVTGAARNIGRATALDLAEGGTRVAINAKTSVTQAEAVKAEIEALGGEALIVPGDVTRPEDVARIVDATVEAWSRVDILVNNAAVRLRAAITDMSFEEWRGVTAVILDGAFLCAKAVIPHTRA